jgi:CRISPR-associated protein Cst2
MTAQIYSLSICGQATLDMHSLNNEGGEGNQIQTRMVEIVDETNRLQTVNAVSGDMLKHIQVEHLHRLSKGKLPLSKGAEILNANRINADDEFITRVKKEKLTPSEILDALIETCTISDLAGILITETSRPVPRKSIAEFGWMVGLPDPKPTTQQYIHAKYVPESPESGTDAEERRGNLAQSLFYRPASSGIYAIVSHLEIARIGFNDITHTYAIDADQRLLRYRALLESVLYSFIQPNGAMRNTQLPHIVNCSGIISYSTQPIPAPMVSPLKTGADKANPLYRQEVEQIATRLNEIHPEAITTARFDDLSQLAQVLGDLIKNGQPYQI